MTDLSAWLAGLWTADDDGSVRQLVIFFVVMAIAAALFIPRSHK